MFIQNGDVEFIVVNVSPFIDVDLNNIFVNFDYQTIKHEVNSGIHQARVTGLKASKGEYVVFLDQVMY